MKKMHYIAYEHLETAIGILFSLFAIWIFFAGIIHVFFEEMPKEDKQEDKRWDKAWIWRTNDTELKIIQNAEEQFRITSECKITWKRGSDK